MGLKDLGKLEKLKITAYKEKSGSNGKTQLDKFDELEVMFNPETYSETFSVVYQKVNNANSTVENFAFVKSVPENFKLKFTIDGTGVSSLPSFVLPNFGELDQYVYEQVNKFLILTWLPNEGKPNLLKISWGKLMFYCRLKDVNIQYTLFSRNGSPLRADLDANFIGAGNENLELVYKDRFGLTGQFGQAGQAGQTGSTSQPSQSSQSSQPSQTGLGSQPSSTGQPTIGKIMINVS